MDDLNLINKKSENQSPVNDKPNPPLSRKMDDNFNIPSQIPEGTIIEDYTEKRHYGKYILILIIVAVVFYFTNGFTFNSIPNEKVAEKLTREHVIQMAKKSCDGEIVVENFSDFRLGEFTKNFGPETINAWPVYANYSIVCTEGKNKITSKSHSEGEESFPLAYVKKNRLGRTEVFIPKSILEMTEKLEKALTDMFNKF